MNDDFNTTSIDFGANSSTTYTSTETGFTGDTSVAMPMDHAIQSIREMEDKAIQDLMFNQENNLINQLNSHQYEENNTVLHQTLPYQEEDTSLHQTLTYQRIRTPRTQSHPIKPLGIFRSTWIFIKTFLKIFIFTAIFLMVFRPTSRAYMTQTEAQITAISLFLMIILASGAYTAYQVIDRRKKIALFNQLRNGDQK